METFVRLAGVAQLGLCVVAAFIPKLLRFRDGLRSSPPLMKHVFWTYAGYIMAINIAMGLLSSLRPHLLVGSGTLGALVTTFIAVYWTARMLIQLFSFTRDAAGTGVPYYRLADAGLKLLFTFLTVVYVAAAWHDWARG